MKEAQKIVDGHNYEYSLLGLGKNKKFNCQDYADALRKEYSNLLNNEEILCKCKLQKK